MLNIRKVIKKIIKSVFRFLFIAVGAGLVGNYIFSLIHGREPLFVEEYIRPNLTYLLIFFATIILFMIFDWIAERKAKLSIIKPIKKLTPYDFRIKKYNEYYIRRKSDYSIESILKRENDNYILIMGKPKIGKTRAAYEAIKKLEVFSIINPEPEKIELEDIKIPQFKIKKNLILFLDDLDRFFTIRIEEVIYKLKKQSKKLLVIATCRSGEKLAIIKRKSLSLFRLFKCIELEDISREDGEKLAKSFGIEWQKRQFDGTPGSVILDLLDMRQRYEKAGDGKVVLKAMKLIKEGNIFFKESIIKRVCADIFELSVEKLKRYKWDEIIIYLKNIDFITKRKSIIYIYPSYLDFCVYDYDPQNDLDKLKDVLIRMKDSIGLLRLGNEHLNKENFLIARDCYGEALRINPRNFIIRANLGYVLTNLGFDLEMKGNYEKAEKIYNDAENELRKSIKINSSWAGNYNNLGYLLFRLGKTIAGKAIESSENFEKANPYFRQAEDNLRAALKLKPDFASAHHNLARVLARMGRDEEAEDEFIESEKQNPEASTLHHHYANFLVKIKRYEEAELQYRKTIEIEQNYSSAHKNLGRLLNKLGRFEEAEKELREAIRISPNYCDPYIKLGNFLSQRKKYEEAEASYKKALEINPNYGIIRNSLGYVLLSLKKYDDAEKEIREAIKLTPNFVKAHTNLASLFSTRGNIEKNREKDKEAKSWYEKAERVYRKVLQIDPNNNIAALFLGKCLLNLERNSEAENCFKKTIEKYPYDEELRNTYGLFLFLDGREEEAKNEFIELIKISSDDLEPNDQIKRLFSLPYHYFLSANNKINKGKLNAAENECLKSAKLVKVLSDSEIQILVENWVNQSLLPSFLGIHKKIGNLLVKIGDKVDIEEKKIELYRKAENEFKEALKTNSKSISVRRCFANVLSKLEKFEEAESEYLKIKELNSTYPQNCRDYAIFLLKIGRKKDAKRELKKAIKLFEKQRLKEEAKELIELKRSL